MNWLTELALAQTTLAQSTLAAGADDAYAPGSGAFDVLVPLPVIVPLIAAALSVVFARSRVIQRAISLLALSAIVVGNSILLARVDDVGDGVFGRQHGT